MPSPSWKSAIFPTVHQPLVVVPELGPIPDRVDRRGIVNDLWYGSGSLEALGEKAQIALRQLDGAQQILGGQTLGHRRG